MPIEVRCPSCDRVLRAPDELVGTLVKCPSCQTTFTAELDRPQPPPHEEAESRSEGIRGPEDRPETRPAPPPRPRPVPRESDWEEEEEAERRARRARARVQVAGPALALMIVGGLALAWATFGLFANALGIAILGAGMGQRMNEAELAGNLSGRVCGMILGFAWAATVLMGGVQMKNLRNYGWAMAGSIVAMVPCSVCCIFGLPFGIWSLVVLNNPDVKRAFR